MAVHIADFCFGDVWLVDRDGRSDTTTLPCNEAGSDVFSGKRNRVDGDVIVLVKAFCGTFHLL